jgi:septal ring factor EnvC (AmiA/AmiB activator)
MEDQKVKQPPRNQCPYCQNSYDSRGIAAHIRKVHPGMPYQPTQEEISAYAKATENPNGAAAPALIPNPPATSHIAIAIKELIAELDIVQKQITELESQLPLLQQSRDKIRFDLEILEKANSAIQDHANARERQLAEVEREVARLER